MRLKGYKLQTPCCCIESKHGRISGRIERGYRILNERTTEDGVGGETVTRVEQRKPMDKVKGLF